MFYKLIGTIQTRLFNRTERLIETLEYLGSNRHRKQDKKCLLQSFYDKIYKQLGEKYLV